MQHLLFLRVGKNFAKFAKNTILIIHNAGVCTYSIQHTKTPTKSGGSGEGGSGEGGREWRDVCLPLIYTYLYLDESL